MNESVRKYNLILHSVVDRCTKTCVFRSTQTLKKMIVSVKLWDLFIYLFIYVSLIIRQDNNNIK